MKRVLLTGATGFVGCHCLQSLLANGYEVHAVSSQGVPASGSAVYWHRVDLLDPAITASLVADVAPSHLLHLAWYAVPGQYWSSEQNLAWVQGSLTLLRAFVSAGGRRMVMAGSCAEYDWRYGWCSEARTPLVPSTLYGTCKHALQLMTSAFARQKDVSWAWGRLFFLYGPREAPDRLVASVVRSLLRNEPVRCTHGNQVRDFLHVRDAADALVTLLDSDVSGPVNIASGKPLGVRELVSRIAEMQKLPQLLHFGAVPARPEDPSFLVADVRRLTCEVGWRPGYDLDAGLRDTITWWQHQLSARGKCLRASMPDV